MYHKHRLLSRKKQNIWHNQLYFFKNKHREHVECTNYTSVVFQWQLAGFLPVSVPKGLLEVPAPWARKRGILLEVSSCGISAAFECRQDIREETKEEEKTGTLVFPLMLPLVSFPNLPAPLLQHPQKAAANILRGVSYLQSVGKSMDCAHPTVAGKVPRPPQQEAVECSFLKAEIFWGTFTQITVSVDATQL